MQIEWRDIPVTGYEVIPLSVNLESPEPTLFLSTFQTRVAELSSLLADLDERGLITDDQLVIDQKAVKLHYKQWPYNRLEEKVRPLHPQSARGKGIPTAESVQIMVSMRPHTADQGQAIAQFILENGAQTAPWQLGDGNPVIDLRANEVMENSLTPLGMKNAIANVQEAGGQQLVFLSEMPFAMLGKHAVPIMVTDSLARFHGI